MPLTGKPGCARRSARPIPDEHVLRADELVDGRPTSLATEAALLVAGRCGSRRAPKKVAWSANRPVPRYGQPDEVASVVLFLASDESSFVTEAEYVVDGGALAGV